MVKGQRRDCQCGPCQKEGRTATFSFTATVVHELEDWGQFSSQHFLNFLFDVIIRYISECMKRKKDSLTPTTQTPLFFTSCTGNSKEWYVQRDIRKVGWGDFLPENNPIILCGVVLYIFCKWRLVVRKRNTCLSWWCRILFSPYHRSPMMEIWNGGKSNLISYGNGSFCLLSSTGLLAIWCFLMQNLFHAEGAQISSLLGYMVDVGKAEKAKCKRDLKEKFCCSPTKWT